MITTTRKSPPRRISTDSDTVAFTLQSHTAMVQSTKSVPREGDKMEALKNMLFDFFIVFTSDSCSILVTVASFSFQVAGAVILLLWSIGEADKKIKAQCLQNNIYWGDFDENGLTTTLSKVDLQTNAKIIYRNIIAFIDIIVGYICAIFVDQLSLSDWCILMLVISCTTLILVVEWQLSAFIARKKYPEDQKIKWEDF